MIFIEVVTDIFEDTFNKITEAKSLARRAGSATARRPVRGLEIKEDTFAVLKVIKADGTEVRLFDSGSSSGDTNENSNFILQSVSEARMEKQQIVETFGQSYIFFFGEKPRFLDVQAVVLNSNDFNWKAEWWANYERYLRGTKLVEMGARAYLFYDDNVVEGYLMMAQMSEDAQNPLMANLAFKFYVTSYSNVSLIGNPDYPTRDGADLSASDEARGGALTRSLIHDNADEWVGPRPGDPPEEIQAARLGLTGDHPDSLDSALMEEASIRGADFISGNNAPKKLNALGIPLIPTSSAGGLASKNGGAGIHSISAVPGTLLNDV